MDNEKNSEKLNKFKFLAESYIRQNIHFETDNSSFLSTTIEVMLDKQKHKSKKDITKEEQCKLIIDNLSTSDKAPELTQQLEKNIARLLQFLSLDKKCNKEIMLFFVVCVSNYSFRRIISESSFIDKDFPFYLSSILNLHIDDVRESYFQLTQIGLIAEHLNFHDTALIPSVFLALLQSDNFKHKNQLFEKVLLESDNLPCSTDDFSYKYVDELQHYLNMAEEQQLSGVNILIYGDHGIGKSDFVKALCQGNKKRVFEIAPLSTELFQKDSNRDQEDNLRTLKFRYYGFAQKLLEHTDNACTLIEEGEEIFFTSFLGPEIPRHKIYKALSDNRRPCFWLMNHTEYLDEQLLSKFSWVLNLASPNAESKLSLLNKALKGLRISAPFKQNLAKTESLSPALIKQVATVAQTCQLKGKAAERLIEHSISSHLVAAHKQAHSNTYQAEIDYSTDLLNIKGDFVEIKRLIDAYKNFPASRLLLHGPAGTGKTAFAHHIAEKTGYELKVIRSSDILGKYVGESEKNVARIFQEAQKNKQMLLIDEIDSLLASRQGLQNNWEVQLVNEFLTQIECFQQPLFATTNYFDNLDKAVLRRFDYKVKLDHLQTGQVCQLFTKLTGSEPTEQQYQILASLDHLTPGDFAIIQRKQRIVGKQSHSELITCLENENQLKQPSSHIGFLN